MEKNKSQLVTLRQKELHGIVAQHALGESVDFTVMLHEYGPVREPYKAYYGQVDAADIVTWVSLETTCTTRTFEGSRGIRM